MIACTVFGEVPNVGGISEASTTPSRPLVPAPMKMMRPPLRSDWVMISTPCAMRSRSFCTAAMTLRSSLQDHFDDVRDRCLVDGEAGRIDGFGWQGLPLGVCLHATRSVARDRAG